MSTKQIDNWTGNDFRKEAARLLNTKIDHTDVEIGAAMLASIREGPDIDKCAKVIGVDAEVLGERWTRLVQSRVFRKGKVYAD